MMTTYLHYVGTIIESIYTYMLDDLSIYEDATIES